jgi:hypothetical protein
VVDAMAISREQLYVEVWAEPMTTVAQRYKVSSSFLARVCERLGVPRPPRGFWAQRAVGIKLEQPPLPKPEPGSELEWVRDGSDPRRQPMLAARRTKQAPRERPDTHALLVGAHAHFMHARENRDEQYQRPYKQNLVDVFVSKELIDGALKFANDFFLALEDRNHLVTLAPARSSFERMPAEVCEGHKHQQDSYRGPGRWKPAGPTLVTVGDVSIGLTVFEVSEEVEVRYDSKQSKYIRVTPLDALLLQKTRRGAASAYQDWTSKRWLPSGRLALHAYSPLQGVGWEKYWRERKPGDLLRQIEAIARELKRAVPAIKELVAKEEREAEERRIKWEAQQREWERREAERQRAEFELKRQKEIAEKISGWRLARDVRAYVDEIQALLKEADMRLTAGGRAEEELNWALAYADRIDPLLVWRADIEKAEHAGKPCPDCGKVHGPGGGTAATTRDGPDSLKADHEDGEEEEADGEEPDDSYESE